MASPDAISSSSPRVSCTSDSNAAAASNACGNSRPITAPICATCLADGKPVEPRHQRGLQRARYGERQRSSTGVCGRFQHRLGQFLDEQRHAIGLRDDPFQQSRG